MCKNNGKNKLKLKLKLQCKHKVQYTRKNWVWKLRKMAMETDKKLRKNGDQNR